MPWCPNCKTEYKEGILICADCSSKLVHEQPAEYEYEPLNGKKEEYLDKEDFDQEDLDREDFDRENLNKEDFDQEDLDQEDEMKESEKVSKLMSESCAYVKKGDKAKEMKSTAITFFFFGIVGLVFVILNILEIVTMIQSIISYIAMTTMFLGFIFVGLNSVQRAKKAAVEAILEEETTKQINDFLTSMVTAESLQSMKDPSLDNEVNFIRILEALKFLVTEKFGQLNEAYLDYVTEEFYNQNFDSE